MGITSENIRNIAVSGHVGTGKTTLVEQLLFTGDAIPKAELVGSGKTVSDCAQKEIEKGISVHTSLSHCTWKDVKINLLDTPGSSDFVGEVVAALRSAETNLMLIDATSGVQIETIKLWRRLDNRNMPRIAFISKMDKERADFTAASKDLEEKFSSRFVPICIPMGSADSYNGLINLIDNKAYQNPEIGRASCRERVCVGV